MTKGVTRRRLHVYAICTRAYQRRSKKKREKEGGGGPAELVKQYRVLAAYLAAGARVLMMAATTEGSARVLMSPS